MTKIKICGVMDTATALTVVEAGADYIGFVLAPSRRQVSFEEAKKIRCVIPSRVKVIGVFVSPTTANILEAIETIHLDGVQIHGEVPVLENITVPVIRAVPLAKLEEAIAYQTVLVDSPQPGSGTVFDWTQLHKVKHPDLWLAGGLSAENIGEAIENVKPTVVDVSSGVETDGKKDVTKIRAFIQTMRSKEDENNDL
ncbi:hypothetical protein BFC19_11410 [Brochothrix thermosphacta]|uniref:phosphoribosylanthranilate isomerase n=1 Tax=Brochothrix thermosphacta TaxID=2756 RepID=UPI000E756FB3|nr:phosphoribosylanthranilate isomerase [Brochothrix thermosphacta]ANZ95952.1 hypothetical protein BFC19_11410 [Brochothrix thermosphacta]